MMRNSNDSPFHVICSARAQGHLHPHVALSLPLTYILKIPFCKIFLINIFSAFEAHFLLAIVQRRSTDEAKRMSIQR